jgi:hypothetical protein
MMTMMMAKVCIGGRCNLGHLPRGLGKLGTVVVRRLLRDVIPELDRRSGLSLTPTISGGRPLHFLHPAC